MNAEAAVIRRSAPANWAHIIRTCSCAAGQPMDPVAKLLVVTRACVQPMTLISVAIAGLLAVRAPGFNPLFYALAALGSVVAHAANNMINDYFDLRSGLDNEAYPRAQYAPHPVLSGLISERGLMHAILAANLIDALIMVVLFVARGWPIVAFALAGLLVSVFYVAPPLRLKARGLGEPSVFLIWGPIMIGGTYFAAVGNLPASVLWASLPYALLVTSVLMGKHVDKAPWDRAQNVKTLPVLLGDRGARRATSVLLIGFYVAIAALVVYGVLPVWTLVAFVALPRLRKTLRAYARPRPAEPPPGYPVWPLWFGPWSFVHSERAGALFVAGLALGSVFPVAL